ncbi:hypothetical protein CgunFtcFv8_009127 [Champsocephalus gunnari]|uniref:Uncharacterized protein n=1 Tax=Champsocephalus gunnari TaxID=52237 RepID=A0AAN8HGD2_CHAGU|nr:hypothetical protein CgunFtcFv8_009127 [Champsocephalus gunnari]
MLMLRKGRRRRREADEKRERDLTRISRRREIRPVRRKRDSVPGVGAGVQTREGHVTTRVTATREEKGGFIQERSVVPGTSIHHRAECRSLPGSQSSSPGCSRCPVPRGAPDSSSSSSSLYPVIPLPNPPLSLSTSISLIS